VPKRPDVILSPADEQLIEDMLAEMEDPDLRAEWDRKLRKKLAARAASSEENRETSNEAFERAKNAGIADIADYSMRARQIARGQKWLNSKAAALKARPQIFATKVANRAADQAEQASKSASPGKRRLLQADRRYLEITGIADRNGQPMTSGSVAAEIKKTLQGYKLPHWEKTTLPLKVLALSIETGKRGGRTINLRISHDASAKALRSSRGPVSFVQNQVRETLKRRFEADAPEFWFVMEQDPKGFHLHGAYEHASHINYLDIDRALRDAGGWGSTQGKGLSQMSVCLKDPIWWAHYTVKQINVTRMLTDRKLFASTAEIRDAARGGWEAVRARMPRG
jgi:hypothetical protein